MGVFARFRDRNASAVDRMMNYAVHLEKELEEDADFRMQAVAIVTFMAAIAGMRLLNGSRIKALSGEHVLDLSALNDAKMYQEVFLAYLNAAILEPILSIGGMEKVVGQELAINFFTLGSICWWIWVVTDAFDYDDIMQHFKYHVDLKEEAEKDPIRYYWLKLKGRDEDTATERQTLAGSIRKDIALWFMLACIAAAWLPGIVTHRHVMHAYVVVILWMILHHACRRATTWTTE
jgi:hypothetical protein